MNNPTLVGYQIAKAREAKGLSSLQLAQRVGIEEVTLLDWESERSSPRANRLAQIAGILGVPLAWLIAGEEAEDVTEYDGPDFKETASIESRLENAEQLIQQLSVVMDDLRGLTRRVQREIDVSRDVI
ncbi:MAG: helix-turn-helix transcriptional regulator [Gammaproteobacteria bacterium]|nr:helix-turn-helix transcriptional regulator [Gammaproteobacteria bacterium]MCP4984426.1 helix-turn-helix transcriptional regulator [Gammaproteobacteria bacterium]